MNGIKDLLASERGVFAIVLVIAATVLTALDIMSKEDWISYTKIIGVALISSKTVTTAVETMSKAPPA